MAIGTLDNERFKAIQDQRFEEAEPFLKEFEFVDHIHSENFSSRELIVLKVLKVLIQYFGSSEYSKQELGMEGLLGPGVTYVEGTNLPAPYGTHFSELIEAEKGSSTP